MEPHHLALPVGFQIEHFRIEAVLGKGGFGITYLAVDLRLGKRVAIKELLPDTIATRVEGYTVVPQSNLVDSWQWARDRFLEEVRVLAGFSHPAIVGVHLLLEANGTVYMVMDYVEGESYEARLQRIGTEPDQASLMAVMGPILSGLEEVHAHGLLHRDIKPENILIDKRGQPVLIDFGSARESVGKTMTMTSIVTHGYSPIEQYQTKGKMGPWTDIYAMGAVIYRAITGDKPPVASDRAIEDPFKPLSTTGRQSGFSAEFCAAINHSLQFRPDHRPQTVEEWRLLEVPAKTALPLPLAGEPIEKHPPPLPAKCRTSSTLLDGLPEAQDAKLVTGGKDARNHDNSGEATLRRSRTPLTRAEKLQIWIPFGILVAALISSVFYTNITLPDRTLSQPHPAENAAGETINEERAAPTVSPLDQYEQAVALIKGDGVPKDEVKGMELLTQAAEEGLAKAQCDLGEMYRDGKGVSQDYAEALRWFRKAAEQGDAFAQKHLGRMYFDGQGVVSRDYAEALKWYRKSAEQGNAQGQNNLGVMYRQGLAVIKDASEALRWFRKAAEQGEPTAQLNIADMYKLGEGVPQDNAEAIKWFHKSAAQGNSWAQWQLGIMHNAGMGVTEDPVEAVAWFRKAAEQGNALGQLCLGHMYSNGRGVAKDDAEAASWYRKAAEQGNTLAQNNLGRLYQQGSGVAKDDAEAVSWYRKAAVQGNADAQCNLGVMYASGAGVAKDEAEAVSWYRKAAEQGNAVAQCNLGVMYASGTGVAKDDTEAVAWLRKAAEQGNAAAQSDLALALSRGEGVAKNPKEAVAWWRKAADQGDATAQSNLALALSSGEGAAKNPKEAVAWWRKAAEQGNAEAQSSLGLCFWDGEGVAKDPKEAVAWWRKAAEQGHAAAQSNLGAALWDGEGVAKNQKEAVAWWRKAAERGSRSAKDNLKKFSRL